MTSAQDSGLPGHMDQSPALRAAIQAGDVVKVGTFIHAHSSHLPFSSMLLLLQVLNLLDMGASIIIDQDGQTALHVAASLGHFDLVEALIQAGCDVGMQDFVSLNLRLLENLASLSLIIPFGCEVVSTPTCDFVFDTRDENHDECLVFNNSQLPSSSSFSSLSISIQCRRINVCECNCRCRWMTTIACSRGRKQRHKAILIANLISYWIDVRPEFYEKKEEKKRRQEILKRISSTKVCH